MIEVKKLTKRYGEKTVFNNLSFFIPEGANAVFTGRSGVGKTTLMRCIAGLESPDSGEITGINGKRLSYVFQENRLIPQISALNNLLCFHPDSCRAKELLAAAGLLSDADTPVSDLSGGMKRRLAVVRALLYGGDIYFFDEPFRELDKSTADTVRELVKRETDGKTVILATHEPADVDFFDALKFEFTGSPMTLANQPL